MKNEGIMSGYQQKKEFYFVFLVTGPTKPPPDENEVNAMQKAHLGNFGKRFNEGKLVAAGPMRDPGKTRRGIVVLTPNKGEDPKKLFAGDPYVENRIMDAVMYKWKPVGEFAAPPDPNSIVEHRLILIHRSDKSDPEDVLMKLSSAKHLGFVSVYGETPGSKDMAAIALSATTNEDNLRRALGEMPAGFKLELIPLWMAKGTVK